MTDTFSQEQVKAYLARVSAHIDRGRIDPAALRNDFSFHQARIRGFDFDIHEERIRMKVSCIDWLKENTGEPNPYLPEAVVFHDVVQLYYKNRLDRREARIFDLQALTISDLLIESKELYASRADRGGRPIALDVQMPLDDTELIILCSHIDIHVDHRVVVVEPQGDGI